MAGFNEAKLNELIEGELGDVTEIRHDLHRHPQTSYEETYASEVVQRELGKCGVDYEAGLAETGVVGWIVPKGMEGMNAIGLRADMDALKLSEETGVDWASENEGYMHACGHDGHTAFLIGAARVLSKQRDDLPCPVKFVFQPAEEGGGGANRMVKEGALEEKIGGVKVGAMLGLHGWSDGEIGNLETKSGPIMACTHSVTIRVHGSGGHAARPHLNSDTIVASAAIVTGLQTIVGRDVEAGDAAVVSIASVQGGEVFNVIPSCVTMLGTIRTLDDDVLEMICERVKAIAGKIAEAHGCRAEVELTGGYPVTANDEVATKYVFGVSRSVLGEDNVATFKRATMGGEDFSYYAKEVPSCFSFIGVATKGAKDYPKLHQPRYDFNDEALGIGMRLMCRYALEADRLFEMLKKQG